MTRGTKVIIFLVILVCAAGGYFISRNKKPEPVQKIVKVVYGRIETAITATGTVQPQNRLEIKPSISGRIEKILVEEGVRVKAGDILALMSSTDRAALLDAAQLSGADALKKWSQAYKPIPLLAPIDGEVIVKAVNPGQIVTQADPVIVLSDRLIVQAQVDETDIGKVKIGQEAVITLDAYPDTVVKARVIHVYYESKLVSNVTIYQVDLLPESVPDVYRSGMSANVRIISAVRDNVLLVPSEYIHRKEGKAYVMVAPAAGEKSVRVEVTAGLSDDMNTEVVSGLQEGEQVVKKIVKIVASGKAAPGANPFMPSRPRSGH